MLNQAAVAAITCVSALLAFPLVAAEVKPAQSFLLAPLYVGSEDNQGTLAFLPNGNVAALLCSGALRSRDCTLVLFRGANNRLEVVTASHDPLLSQFHGDIYGLADSRVFAGLRRGGAIFSPDLLTRTRVFGAIFRLLAVVSREPRKNGTPRALTMAVTIETTSAIRPFVYAAASISAACYSAMTLGHFRRNPVRPETVRPLRAHGRNCRQLSSAGVGRSPAPRRAVFWPIG